MLDHKAVIEKAMAFPMDQVVYRYQQEQELPEAQARRHERELKRFLALVALNDRGYGLSGPIDGLWHTFILFTKLYARFCREVAGRFIHHEPNVIGYDTREDRDTDGAASPGSNSYEMFLHDYQAIFNEVPSAHIWPRSVQDQLARAASAIEGCRGEPGEECRGEPGEECRGVPGEECRGITMASSRDIMFEECRGEPGEECRGEPECRGVPGEECRGVMVQAPVMRHPVLS